jgi:hypothetical protein
MCAVVDALSECEAPEKEWNETAGCRRARKPPDNHASNDRDENRNPDWPLERLLIVKNGLIKIII